MASRWPNVLAAALIAVGIAAAGIFVAQAYLQARVVERFVTVKGLSERPVKADLALWPMRFVSTGDDLGAVQAKIEADAGKVRAFLAANDLPADTIVQETLDVTDLLAQQYRSGPVESRFIITQTLMVRSDDVDAVEAASRRVSDLVTAGVVLHNENFDGGGPIFLFTQLNDIKTEMLAEATANARDAAAQFAADAESQVGTIRRASQGVFQILARDEAPGIQEQRQVEKTVRVVSTLEYRLVD